MCLYCPTRYPPLISADGNGKFDHLMLSCLHIIIIFLQTRAMTDWKVKQMIAYCLNTHVFCLIILCIFFLNQSKHSMIFLKIHYINQALTKLIKFRPYKQSLQVTNSFALLWSGIAGVSFGRNIRPVFFI